MKFNKTYFYILSIGISILIIIGVYAIFSSKIEQQKSNKALGTCKTPEEAFYETQSALRLISQKINYGTKNDRYKNEFKDGLKKKDLKDEN